MLQTWLRVVRIGGRLLRLLRISLCIVWNLLVVPLLRERTASACFCRHIWCGVDGEALVSTEATAAQNLAAWDSGPAALTPAPLVPRGVSAGTLPCTPTTHLRHLLRHLPHLLQHLRVHPVRVLILRTGGSSQTRRPRPHRGSALAATPRSSSPRGAEEVSSTPPPRQVASNPAAATTVCMTSARHKTQSQPLPRTRSHELFFLAI